MSSSSSSYSLAPANVCRQCRRLAEPDSRTIESIAGSVLILNVTLPIDIVYRYASMIPNNGVDTLTIHYTDYTGQAATLTRNVTFWMSDDGYVFLSADQGYQLLIASVNATFWQANAAAINARNVSASAAALQLCCNFERYDAPQLLPNQQLPTTFIRDGVTVE